jgi:hypothetical protein
MKLYTQLLLIGASTVFALALCETAARLLGLGGGPPSLEQAGAGAGKPLDASAAMRYVNALAAAPGTERAWFLESPPPLERKPASAAARERFREFERRGLFAPQAEYLWNRHYVETERCRPNGRLAGFPPTVEVFDPPQPSLYPRYRFPAGVTMVSGLVTNQFGLRGHGIDLAKPPRTVRIAFVGASTTVDFHYFAYSYPEYVEFWLNRWAEAMQLAVRFEVLNGGREGLSSADIAAIVKHELRPLDPDLTVYYEGANQFWPYPIIDPPIPPRQQLDASDQVVQPRLPRFLRNQFVLGAYADRALNGFHSAGEPRKPQYRMVWPAGVDERNPDPNRADLPLNLSLAVQALDSIRGDMETVGGELAVCSFAWLVRENLQLSPVRHAGIYQHLNTFLWPLKYSDARRLADFQNRVFRNYASSRKAGFLDVAAALPQSPDLFLDAIHLTETGTRLKAWIAFQQLVPLVRERIGSGRWPRAAGSHALPERPVAATGRTSTACVFPTGPLDPISGGISMAELAAEHGVPPLEPGPPVKVWTGTTQYTFGARAPLHLPPGESGTVGVVVKGRSLAGQIGLGVYDREAKDLQAEVALAPSEKSTEIWVPVLAPERATALIIRNLAATGSSSQMQVEEIRVVRRAGGFRK